MQVDGIAKLQLEWEKSTFWTDNTTVLNFIRNGTKCDDTFGAVRMYVVTKPTPADEPLVG